MLELDGYIIVLSTYETTCAQLPREPCYGWAVEWPMTGGSPADPCKIEYHNSTPTSKAIWQLFLLRKLNRYSRVPVMHYDDVIIGTIASQITSLTVVYSTVYSDADQRKHQISASLAFVWGIHRWIPRRKGQLRGKCFHSMTSSWYYGVRSQITNKPSHKPTRILFSDKSMRH